MKTFQLISAVVLATLLLASMASAASADGTEVFTEKVCETNAYGQETCRDVTREKPSNVQRVDEPHQPVNAGLDLPSALAVGSLMTSGLAAYAIKRSVK